MSIRRLMPRMILAILAASALTGCASLPLMHKTPPALACGSLIPDSWRKPVPGAARPTDNTAGAWVGFGLAQTENLDTANGRLNDTLTLVDKCDSLNKRR